MELLSRGGLQLSHRHHVQILAKHRDEIIDAARQKVVNVAGSHEGLQLLSVRCVLLCIGIRLAE
ncbi:MAG: hypothetical protein CMJ75_00365, partial [Planctomycetaceae bacterium]|nr:hypothetical protein [Planctomycetaceae bacterium]